MRGYFGYFGLYALMGTDALLDTELGNERPQRRLDEYPVVRRFVRQSPLRSTSFESDFYAMVEESRRVTKTFDKMMRELRPEDAEQYLEGDEGRQLARALNRSVNSWAKKISDLRSRMNLVWNSRDLSPAEKRKEIDDLRTAMNESFKAAAEELSKEEFQAFRERVQLRR